MDSARDGYLLPKPFQTMARWSHARIVLFTDGVSESWNAAGEEFGETRIIDAAKSSGGAGAEETQHRILDALDAFARGRYHDDVTTVVLSVRPNGSL
jgi:serine phosphatase RsbU (regulator of sigma subunit)